MKKYTDGKEYVNLHMNIFKSYWILDFYGIKKGNTYEILDVLRSLATAESDDRL